jgi:cobalamin biosynthesis protein CobD/CbiB
MLLATCQGLGLAIAVGLILGVVFPPIMPSWGAVVGAAPLGVLACGAALNGAGEPLWPALPVGVIGAGLAAVVAQDVASGAARRQQDRITGADLQASGGVTAIVVLAAVIVAAVSLVLKPFSLLVLVALLWVWISRRRRAERKHEGLRVLR